MASPPRATRRADRGEEEKTSQRGRLPTGGAELASRTVVELRGLLREQGQPTEGLKSVLVARASQLLRREGDSPAAPGGSGTTRATSPIRRSPRQPPEPTNAALASPEGGAAQGRPEVIRDRSSTRSPGASPPRADSRGDDRGDASEGPAGQEVLKAEKRKLEARLAELEKALAPPRNGRGPDGPLGPEGAAEDLLDVLQSRRAAREAILSTPGEDPTRTLLSVGAADEVAPTAREGAATVDLAGAGEEDPNGPTGGAVRRPRGQPTESLRGPVEQRGPRFEAPGFVQDQTRAAVLLEAQRWAGEWDETREQPERVLERSGGPAPERRATPLPASGLGGGPARTVWRSDRSRRYGRGPGGDAIERAIRLATDPVGQWTRDLEEGRGPAGRPARAGRRPQDSRDGEEGTRASPYGTGERSVPARSGSGERVRGEGRSAGPWNQSDSRTVWGPTGGTRGRGGSEGPSVRVEEQPGPMAHMAQSVEHIARAAAQARSLIAELAVTKQEGGKGTSPQVALKQFALSGFGQERSPVGLTPGEPGQIAKVVRALGDDPVGNFRDYGLRAHLSKTMLTKVAEGNLSDPLELFRPVPVPLLANPPAPAKGAVKPETDIPKLFAMAREKALLVGVVHRAGLTKALLAHFDRVKALWDSSPIVTDEDVRVLVDQAFNSIDDDSQEVAEAILGFLRSVGETPTSAGAAVDKVWEVVMTPGNQFEGFDAAGRLDPEAVDNLVSVRLERLRFVDEARTQAANAAHRSALAKKPNTASSAGEKDVASARGSGLSEGVTAATTPAEKRRAAILLGGNVCIAFNSHDGCPHGQSCRHAHEKLPSGSGASQEAVVRLAFAPHGGVREGPRIPPEERPGAIAELRRVTRGVGGGVRKGATARKGENTARSLNETRPESLRTQLTPGAARVPDGNEAGLGRGEEGVSDYLEGYRNARPRVARRVTLDVSEGPQRAPGGARPKSSTASPTGSGSPGAPPGLGAVQVSHHALGQPLAREVQDLLEPRGPPRTEGARGTIPQGPDSARLVNLRKTAAAVRAERPVVARLGDDCQALIYNVVHKELERHPERGGREGLLAGLEEASRRLASSTLPDAALAATVLDDKGATTLAAGVRIGPGDLAVARCVSSLTGEPLVQHPTFTAVPEGQEAWGHVGIAGRVCPYLDHGERLGGLGGNCVLLCLAYAMDVRPGDLQASLREEAAELLQSLGPPGEKVAPEQVQAYQVAHDLLCPAAGREAGSYDAHLVRYLGGPFVRGGGGGGLRFVFVVANGRGSPTELHVVAPGDHDNRPNITATAVIMLSEQHAVSLGPPASKGGRDDVPPRWTNQDGDALLGDFARNGLRPRFFPAVGRLAFRDCGKEGETVDSGALHPCGGCGAHLRRVISTRAGRGPGAPPGEQRVASAKAEKTHLLQPSLPFVVDQWMARHDVAAARAFREGRAEGTGFSAGTLRELANRRSLDFRRFAGLNRQAITEATLPPGSARAAARLVDCARGWLGDLDRKAIKERDPSALRGLVSAVVEVAGASEALMRCAGGPRASMLALRQRAYARGEVPLDVDRLEKVRHLYDAHVFRALQNLADYGMPLFQLDEMTAANSWPSHAGAAEVAPEILLAALDDVGRGSGLFGSWAGGGLQAFIEAGATWSPVGSTPKRDAEGNVTGTRVLTDLRELNAAVAATLPEVKSRTGLSPPPAVCSDLGQLVRAIVHTHLKYQNGVSLVIADLNSAYKMIHVAIADAPAQTMSLPVGTVKGLSTGLLGLARGDVEAGAPLAARGDTRELAFMAGVGMFGGSAIPGFFGLPAWAVVQGASRLVAKEPHLNGGSTTPAQCHVDDAALVAPDLGDRAIQAQRGYRYVAETVFGEGAINDAKGGVGPAQNVWGYRVDLSDIYDHPRGLEAGSIVVYEAKFRKFLRILEGPGFYLLARRVVSSEAHKSAAGLLVWLSRTSVALRQLLGGFNVMAAAAQQAPYLRPEGSPATVDAAWTLYDSTVRVLKEAFEHAAAFKGSITSSLFGALSLEEQTKFRPVSWTGTDASLEPKRNSDGSIRLGEDGRPEIEAGYGWVDHQLKVFACGDLKDVNQELKRLFGDDHKLIIYVAEVLTAVAGAVEFGRDWSGHLKGVPIDNSNGYYAFRSFRSTNNVVRFLLGILARSIVGNGFDWAPFWVWTKDNELPDLLSRGFGEGDAAVQAVVDAQAGPGYRRVDLMPRMMRVLRAFAGNPARSAFQFAEGDVAYVLGPRPWVTDRRRKGVARGGAVVLGGGCGAFLRAFPASGFERLAVCEPRREYAAAARTPQGEPRSEPAGRSLAEAAEVLRTSPGWEAVIVDATAWSIDETWHESLRTLLKQVQPLAVVVVAAGGAGARGWNEHLGGAGYGRVAPHSVEEDQGSNGPAAESLSTTELGGLVRRELTLLHFELTALAEKGARIELPRLESEPGLVSPTVHPFSWRESLDPPDKVPAWTWCDAPFTPSRRVSAMGQPLELGSVTLGGVGSPPCLGARVVVNGRRGAWIVTSLRAGRSVVVSESDPGRTTTVPTEAIVGLSPRRVAVYSVDGPVPALDVDGYPPAGVGGALFLDDRCDPPRVRAHSMNELWTLHGLSTEQLKQFRKEAPRASRRDQARAAVYELQREVAEAVWKRLTLRVQDLQHGLRLKEGADGRWERTTEEGPGTSTYLPTQVGSPSGGARAGAPAAVDPDEVAYRALGERLYAAAESIWPGSGGRVAGCILEFPLAYGEELLGHPKEMQAAVREVILGSGLFGQVLAQTQREDVARRVTGMLLELSDQEVAWITYDSQALGERVAEAASLLGNGDDLWVRREGGTADDAPDDGTRSRVGGVEGEGPPATTRAGGGRRGRTAPTCSLSAPEAVQYLITNSVATGTHSTYSSSMKHWARFRRYRGRPIFFVAETPAEVQDELVLFVAFKGVVQNFAYGTVHVMLYAIRFFHVMERLPDPLANKPLLTVALRGLKRLQGGPRRKIPVTMRILERSLTGLKLDVWDDLVKITAAASMFVFLLRSREALRKGGTPDPDQCLRVGNLVMSAGGHPLSGVDVAAADEAVLFMGKSKADQEGQGHVLNAYATDHWLCVVSLLKLMHLARPGHFEEPRNFLFTLDDGRVLSRDSMVELLRVGGVAEGVPANALSVISLRAGGASALWELGYSVEEIKRRGRWLSDAWRCYVWESRERWRNVAGDMLSTKGCLMAAIARFERG